MWLADTSIRRPVFATMFILALVILGLVSYPEIGVDLFPKVDFPIVNITTRLKGASPEIMDIDVTDKIEEVVNTINGVKSITSTSIEGASLVTVEFVLERDIDLAVQDVREKVSVVRQKLPRDINEPIIEKVDPDATPVLWFNLAGRRSVRDLSMYADEVLKEQFQRVNGVGAIRLGGLRLREVRVWLDANKLQAYQIAANDVLGALQRENVELPGGRIETASKEYTVKIKGEFPNVPDFNDLIVTYYKGVPVRLRDIGRVEDGMQEKRSLVRFNGVPAVGIGVQKQSGTNTVEVINRVKKELSGIIKTLPPGMTLNIAFDQSTFIKRSINEVQKHLILGSLFAVIAVFIFLRNLRTTLITAVALPVSIVSTFAMIRFFGFTFNNMTMLALSLSVGLLIDDAIIVVENIYRHIEEGREPREAASFGTSEIGLAVMATTFAIVAIFLPVAFMKGMVGRFFLQFALTVVFSVLVSMLVSFTLTPMIASIFLKRMKSIEGNPIGTPSRFAYIYRMGQWFETGYKKMEGAYRRLLGISLRYRKTVLVLALVLFLFSLYITKFMGKEFIPPEDQSQFIVRLEAPIDYSIDKADDLFKKAEQILRETPEVKTVFYALGFGLTPQINRAVLFVRLKPRVEREKSQEQIKAEVRKKTRQIAGLKATAEDIAMIGGGQRIVPIQYSIRGRDLSSLQTYTRQIVAEFSRLPGIVDVDTSLETGKPELKVYIDRDKAADMGVDVATVAQVINILISGELDITKFKDETRGKRYEVRVRLNPEDRKDPDDLTRLYVRSRDGRLVELSSVVRIQEGGGPNIINRVDRQRAVTVFASLEGKPLGQAMGELDAISAKVLPPDYLPKYKGMAETMGESFRYLLFALILGVVMAYMILASQFESFVHPFTVLLAMPLIHRGIRGAPHYREYPQYIQFDRAHSPNGACEEELDPACRLYTNTLRERGMSRQEAILHACPVRLRPILMTTLAMVFGMMPVAFGIGEGSETRSPMGISVIGGLLTSLFLTLLVVPAAYDLFDDWLARFVKKRKGRGE